MFYLFEIVYIIHRKPKCNIKFDLFSITTHIPNLTANAIETAIII